MPDVLKDDKLYKRQMGNVPFSKHDVGLFLNYLTDQVDKNLRYANETSGGEGNGHGHGGSHGGSMTAAVGGGAGGAGQLAEDALLEKYLDQAYVDCMCSDDEDHFRGQEAQVVTASAQGKLREADEKVGVFFYIVLG